MKKFIFNKFVLLAVVSLLSLSAFAQTNAPVAQTAQKANVVRVGLASVKAGSVGEGMNGAELAGAVQNSLGDFLKSPRIEVVPLDSKLATAIEGEAKEKQCDYVIYAQVSHKKGGGGGFGMFKTIAPVLGSVVPMVGIAGGMAGVVASSVASTAITSAATATANVKPKDELTLDLKVNAGNGTALLTKQFKAKAKSQSEDILSPMLEQAAQTIIDTVAK